MSTACDVQPIAADLCCGFQSVAWKVSEMHALKRFGVTTIEGVFFFCATTFKVSDKTEQVDGKSNVIIRICIYIYYLYRCIRQIFSTIHIHDIFAASSSVWLQRFA